MAGSVVAIECRLAWWVSPFLIVMAVATAPVWPFLPRVARTRVVDFVGSIAARGITVVSE